MTRGRIERGLLAIILLGYAIVGAAFAIFTPAWQAPDEPAHYNYVAQVARNGCCPVIEVGDWDQAYLKQLTTEHFKPELLGKLDTIQYEDHQPPLYYLLASVVFKVTNGSLVALRLFSVLLGAGIVVCAYGVGKVMLPNAPAVGLGAAAVVAFVPQHVAMLAAVENDALAELLIAVTLLATVIYLKAVPSRRISVPEAAEPTAEELPPGTPTLRKSAVWSAVSWREDTAQPAKRAARTLFNAPTPLVLGLLVGLGLITKASTYFLAGIVPLAMLMQWWMVRKEVSAGAKRAAPLPTLARDLALFLVPALILGGLWWVHNFGVYGFPDFLGLRQHNLVVADQGRTVTQIAAVGWGEYLREGAETTFHSFWGQFGWMALPMPDWVYSVLLVVMAIVIAGLVMDVIRGYFIPTPSLSTGGEMTSDGTSTAQRQAWLIVWLTALLAVVQYVYYNTEFLQLQGRYMFPGLIPFGLGMALGVEAWRRVLLRRVAWAEWLAAVVFLPLAVLDLYLLWRFIVPLLRAG